MADSIIVATAKAYNAQIITSDKHLLEKFAEDVVEGCQEVLPNQRDAYLGRPRTSPRVTFAQIHYLYLRKPC